MAGANNHEVHGLPKGGFVVIAADGAAARLQRVHDNGDLWGGEVSVPELGRAYDTDIYEGLKGGLVVTSSTATADVVLSKKGLPTGTLPEGGSVDGYIPKGGTSVALGAGKYLQVWLVFGLNPASGEYVHNLHARVLDKNGNQLGGIKDVMTNETGLSVRPQLARLDDGSVAIFWKQDDHDEVQTFMRRVDKSGDFLGPAQEINLSDGPHHSEIEVVGRADGGIFAVSVRWFAPNSFYSEHSLRFDTELSGGARQGSNRADKMAGGKGEDLIAGRGGNDLLKGKGGDDALHGGGGKDRLLGGAGNDLLKGDGGNDRLIGSAGRDVLIGDAGNDLLNGGQGADVLLGRAGNDVLLGGGGDDEIAGNKGNDQLEGGGGDDSLRGDEGDDVIDGGAGVDTATGGGGQDTFVFSKGDGTLYIKDANTSDDHVQLQTDGWAEIEGMSVAEIVAAYGQEPSPLSGMS